MAHEVIMPALGMAQDTGLIVSWLKAPGDAVKSGDPLFEVETDKSVMEVEAPADGFLSGVTAAAGEDVPVGNVIAQIVASVDEVETVAPASAPREETPAPSPVAEASTSEPRPEPVAQAPAPEPPRAAPMVSTGRVLASPKARRLADEKGIDLGALRSEGVAEPILAGDLASAGTGRRSVLSARVDGSAIDALLAQAGDDLDRSAFFAAFAARAWAAVFDAAEPVIAVQDTSGAASLRGEGEPALRLVDLTATRLTGYAPAGGLSTIAVSREGGAIALTFSFSEGVLGFPDAARWLDDMAARLENPIRQLM